MYLQLLPISMFVLLITISYFVPNAFPNSLFLSQVIAIYKHIPHDAPPDYSPAPIGGPNSKPPLDPQPTPPLVPPPQSNEPLDQQVPTDASSATAPPSTSPMYFVNSPSAVFTKPYSPVPSYRPDVYEAQRDFATTPTNCYAPHDSLIGSGNKMEVVGSSDYSPHGGVQSNDGTENLSQVIDDDYSQDILQSQISLHSEEGAHGGPGKFPPGPGGTYDIVDVLTPSSGYGTNMNKSSMRSASQQSLDTIHKQGQVDSSPYHSKNSNNRFSFSHSQSMERLHEFQQGHYYRGGGVPPPSYHQQLALSQDFSQDTTYFPPDQMGGGYMTQPEGSMWNQRLHPSQFQQQRYWGVGSYDPRQYPPMHQMMQRQYPHGGGRGMPDPYDRRLPEGEYYHGYPQLNDPRKRNSAMGVPGEYYDEHFMGGGRGSGSRYGQAVPRGWGKPYEDDYQRQILREEDQLEFPLSQPASYSGRYPYAPPPSLPMGRLMNGPSGYSLSQPGGGGGMRSPHDKHKQKKSALKNRNEQSPRSDLR